MLFLVQGVLQTSRYMQQHPEKETLTRLVEAKDEEEACAKFTKHFEDQTDEYHTYYTIHSTEAHAIIE